MRHCEREIIPAQVFPPPVLGIDVHRDVGRGVVVPRVEGSGNNAPAEGLAFNVVKDLVLDGGGEITGTGGREKVSEISDACDRGVHGLSTL
jgi:hypothetical protein